MLNIPLVDLRAQYQALKPELDAKIKEIIEHTAFIKGKDLERFEREFAEYCGVKRCVAVKSGTAALFLAFKALELGPGEVIIPVNTFIATAEVIHQNNLSIKFVDVDRETFLMDLEGVKAAITPYTKAIVPVHLYGQMVDMHALKELIGSRDIKIIEDACQSVGANINGVGLAKFSDIACVSFFPSKVLGAYGDGGAILTNSNELADKIAMLRDHGRKPSDKYIHTIEGYNERLDNLQAGILRVKLRHLEEWLKARQRNAMLYNNYLKDVSQVVLPKTQPNAKHVYYVYVVMVERRDELREYLKQHGVASGIHYPVPLHLQPAYNWMGLKEGDFPVAEYQAKRILSLPMYPELSEEQIKKICELIKEFYERH